MNVIKIVKGNNLRELIENALSGYHTEYIDIQDYRFETEYTGTIVEGKVNIGYWDNDEYIEDNCTYEVNIGTDKEDLVLFDEFEVIIG